MDRGCRKNNFLPAKEVGRLLRLLGDHVGAYQLYTLGQMR